MKSTYLSREAVYETFLWQPKWTEWFRSHWHCSLLSNSLKISWAVWMVIATVVTWLFSSGHCTAQCRRALSVLLAISLSCESLQQNPWDRMLRRRRCIFWLMVSEVSDICLWTLSLRWNAVPHAESAGQRNRSSHSSQEAERCRKEQAD